MGTKNDFFFVELCNSSVHICVSLLAYTVLYPAQAISKVTGVDYLTSAQHRLLSILHLRLPNLPSDPHPLPGNSAKI